MSGGSGDDWCTIESDPGVFTELLEEIGCTQVQLEELWSLDDETLQQLQNTGHIHGLIFLFQWGENNNKSNNNATDNTSSLSSSSASSSNNNKCLSEDEIPPGLFFAHQVTTNACATQAILSVVLNADTDKLELGTTLSEFKEFTTSFPPSLKGVAISGSEPIKKAHNAFGRTDAFLNDGKQFFSPHRETEDVFHFVAYIPHTATGKVYELDGLQQGPIVVGEYNNDASSSSSWLSVARDAIQKRMMGDAIKFNLMAVIQDKRIGLRKQLEEADGEAAAATDKESIAIQLQMEDAKRTQWKLENQRRRHNYVPLCVSILKELAASGKLPELVEKAKERKLQQKQNRAAKKF